MADQWRPDWDPKYGQGDTPSESMPRHSTTLDEEVRIKAEAKEERQVMLKEFQIVVDIVLKVVGIVALGHYIGWW